MKVFSFEQTEADYPGRMVDNLTNGCTGLLHGVHGVDKGTMNSLRQPKEPKAEVVEYAIVELLEIAQRQGITPRDFIELLESGMRISDFLAAMTPLRNSNDKIDCDS